MKHIIITSIILTALSATAQKPGPDVQFKSLFQIRAASPDTIELIHIAYNISITPDGVEVLKITPPVGQPTTHKVETWVQETGRWIGVTRDGVTLTWDTSGPEPFFEIASHRQVLDMYVMAPVVLRWEKRPDN